MKRAIALLGATLVLTGVGVAVPAAACACGAAAPPDGAQVRVDHEVAIVRWDGAQEEIVMRLAMAGDTADTGLVVPTPSPATVSAGDAALFDALERELLPVVITEYDWWGGFGDGASSGGAEGSRGPEVLDQVQLGPIQATTLAADDADGLAEWLDVNGYGLPEAVTERLSVYVDDGWSFVALKLTADLPLSGELDPIRFTFDSDALVYPMRLAAAATTPQSVRLYLPGEHRSQIDARGAYREVVFAGVPSQPEVSALGAYLTVIDLAFAEPASIDADLVVTTAPDDAEVVPTVVRTELVQVFGVPAGWLLVGVAIVVLLVALLLMAAVLTRRRGNPQPQ